MNKVTLPLKYLIRFRLIVSHQRNTSSSVYGAGSSDTNNRTEGFDAYKTFSILPVTGVNVKTTAVAHQPQIDNAAATNSNRKYMTGKSNPGVDEAYLQQAVSGLMIVDQYNQSAIKASNVKKPMES